MYQCFLTIHYIYLKNNVLWRFHPKVILFISLKILCILVNALAIKKFCDYFEYFITLYL